jgi:glucose uptake protein GlcU
LRNAQLEKAKALAGGEVVRVVSRIEVNLRALPSGARVPLLDLCMPALRQLSTQQQVAFGQSIDQAIYDADDGLIVLLIHAMMRRQLAVAVPQTTWQGDLPQACSLVLSAVVQTSSEDEVAQKRAYFLGCRALQLPGLRLAIINSAEVDLASVESALGFIFSQRMQFRRQFVHVCGIAMLSDGKVEPAEVEIVRAVAESLGVVIATA